MDGTCFFSVESVRPFAFQASVCNQLVLRRVCDQMIPRQVCASSYFSGESVRAVSFQAIVWDQFILSSISLAASQSGGMSMVRKRTGAEIFEIF